MRLTVSKGVQPVTVPNLVGQESTAAQATLLDLGLKPKVTGEKFSTTVPKGSVLQQTPKSGTVDKGSQIELVVSKGPKLFEVPNVFGKRTNEAVSILEGAGFTVKIEKILGGIFDTGPLAEPRRRRACSPRAPRSPSGSSDPPRRPVRRSGRRGRPRCGWWATKGRAGPYAAPMQQHAWFYGYRPGLPRRAA